MPAFKLDTGGLIPDVPPSLEAGDTPNQIAQLTRDYTWSDLDAFTQGYIEALFFTENEPGTVHRTEDEDDREYSNLWDPARHLSLPGDVGFSDLAPEALEAILKDCREFQTMDVWLDYTHRRKDGEDAPERYPDDAEGGRDFWYTRNGHSCGFWDGDWPEPYGADLTKASKAFGEVDVDLGDNGKVYLS